MKNMPSVNTSTPHSGGMIRWTAPELLGVFFDNHKKPIPTAKSDVYTLSMVIIEVGVLYLVDPSALVHALLSAVHRECSFHQQPRTNCHSHGDKGWEATQAGPH